MASPDNCNAIPRPNVIGCSAFASNIEGVRVRSVVEARTCMVYGEVSQKIELFHCVCCGNYSSIA